jgi:hypothetical protein
MVEAAVSLPLVILAAMLMLRMFVFYLDILTTGIEAHRDAMKMQDTYSGSFMHTYKNEERVSMLRGGLLAINVSKRLEVKAYLINEDALVRTGEIFGKDHSEE